jgi:hypothetical protein
MSTGNFPSLNIANNINIFNADGSYMLRGSGIVGSLNAAQLNSRNYIISSGNTSNPLGILDGGVGYLQGLNIFQPVINTNFAGTNGNLTFTGNYIKQGIKFADGSFLNSANNFNNISTSNINSDTGTFKSLNIIGNLNNDTNAVFSNLSCSSTANFRNINTQTIKSENGIFSSLTISGTGNNTDSFNLPSANILKIFGNTLSYSNAIIPNITTNTIDINNMTAKSADIFSINGNSINISGESKFANTVSNNINTSILTFSDGSKLTTAPGGTFIIGTLSRIWNPDMNTSNAPITLSIGTWVINFNIYFPALLNNNINGSNFIKCTSNNTFYPINIIQISDTNNIAAVCNGSYIYTTNVAKTIDLVTLISSTIDVSKSFHNAIKIS